jgi:hypothetical protein
MNLLGVEDPVSLPPEDRKKATSVEEFFDAEEGDLVRAFSEIQSELKHPYTDDLFVFMMNVRRYSTAYSESGELWKAFGGYDNPQLVNIQMNAERHTGQLVIARFTKEKLLQLREDPRQQQWAEFYLSRLDNLEGKIMILLFTDDEMSRIHGFPFDVMLTSIPT